MDIHSNSVYHVFHMKLELSAIRKHKFTKDFSWGFYCTTSKEEAEKSAIKFIPPIINVYKINYLNSLNIKKFEDYNDEWLDFVIICRSGDTHSYDVVIGPMEADTIYYYMIAYNNGQLNK